MIIINDKETNIIYSNALSEINIHISGLKIMGRFNVVGSRDAVLGEYDDKKKCKRAFGLLASALADDKVIFYMPNNNSGELQTHIQQSHSHGYSRTAGKQK